MSGVVHAFPSAVANTADPLKVGSTRWNAEHLFTSGNIGSIVIRGSDDTLDALSSVASGSFVRSNGLGLVPVYGVLVAADIPDLSGTYLTSAAAAAEYASVFNVRGYGAIGNGSTDDTAAIQAAIDAAFAAGGGVVWFPQGIYKTTNTIIVKSGVSVRGAGRGSAILRPAAGAYAGVVVNGATIYATLAMVSVTRASVASLTVDHATNSTTSNGIAITVDGAGTAAQHCTIVDCEVLPDDSATYAIWNFKGQHTKILFNYVDGGITTSTATAQEGIESFGGEDVLVAGNTVQNVGANGIYVTSDATSGESKYIRIRDNYIYRCKSGIRVAAGTHARSVHLHGNQISAPWEYGIVATIGTGVTFQDLQLCDNSVDGGLEGIRLIGHAAATFKQISVRGNTLRSQTSTNTGALVLSIFSNTAIDNNAILDSASSGMYLATTTSITARGNLVENTQHHSVYGDTCTSLLLAQNSFKSYNEANGDTPGAYFTTTTKITVQNNEFTKGTYEAYGVWALPSCDRVSISDNQVRYTPTFNPVFRNDSTNPEVGLVRGRFLALAATTTQVSLRVPHGSAPTSPVDGDIWTTTAGVFVRVNGTTVGPLS